MSLTPRKARRPPPDSSPPLAALRAGTLKKFTEWWRPAGTPVANFSQLTPADADGILVKGEKGDSIKKLQAALGVVADGHFGPATERAVVAFQKARGLAPDGVAGPKTLAALGIAVEVA